MGLLKKLVPKKDLAGVVLIGGLTFGMLGSMCGMLSENCERNKLKNKLYQRFPSPSFSVENGKEVVALIEEEFLRCAEETKISVITTKISVAILSKPEHSYAARGQQWYLITERNPEYGLSKNLFFKSENLESLLDEYPEDIFLLTKRENGPSIVLGCASERSQFIGDGEIGTKYLIKVKLRGRIEEAAIKYPLIIQGGVDHLFEQYPSWRVDASLSYKEISFGRVWLDSELRVNADEEIVYTTKSEDGIKVKRGRGEKFQWQKLVKKGIECGSLIPKNMR